MLTDKQIRDIRIYSGYGYTYSEIAEKTGAKYSEIRTVINMKNKELKEMFSGKIPEEIRNDVKECLKNGMSQRQTSIKLGVSQATVNRIFKDIANENDPAEIKKEPASAATVASSENKEDTPVSEDIISPTEENVKPETKASVPAVIAEAALEQLTRLRGSKEEYKAAARIAAENFRESIRAIEELERWLTDNGIKY